MPRRSRRNGPFLLATFAVAGLLLAYVVGWPLVSAWLAPPRALAARPRPLLAPLAAQIPIRLFEFFILAWLFVFGSCIGSFLNVVIYRTPRRLSLWGSSFCPRCRVRIPAWDNLPVFGWLKLRGRCRTCRLPISPRYPLVELTVGLVILVLATLEILLAAVNLPDAGARTPMRLGISWLIGHPRWDLIGTCVLHSGLVCVLLSWAFIRYDGYAVPRRYALGALVAAWLLVAFEPLWRLEIWQQGPVAWQAWLAAWSPDDRGLWGLLGGLLVGAVTGVGCFLASRPAREPPSGTQSGTLSGPTAVDASQRVASTWHEQSADALLGLGLVGVGLGWHAAVSVGLLAAAARLLGALTLGLSPRFRPLPLLAYTCLAAFVQLCLWRVWDGWAFWPGSSAGLPTFAAALATVLVLSWQAGVLERLVSTP
jgi:leader peptidase (prepilin peptidase) / N-methyltransferase